jgi:hypothetical protein
MPDLGPMSVPEIATVNQVRWRLSIAAQRLSESLELVREAAAAPGYCGPALATVEQVDEALAALRAPNSRGSLTLLGHLENSTPKSPRCRPHDRLRSAGSLSWRRRREARSHRLS